jgi:hypothetical protein
MRGVIKSRKNEPVTIQRINNFARPGKRPLEFRIFNLEPLNLEL